MKSDQTQARSNIYKSCVLRAERHLGRKLVPEEEVTIMNAVDGFLIRRSTSKDKLPALN